MPPVHQPRGANTSVGLVVNLEITNYMFSCYLLLSTSPLSPLFCCRQLLSVDPRCAQTTYGGLSGVSFGGSRFLFWGGQSERTGIPGFFGTPICSFFGVDPFESRPRCRAMVDVERPLFLCVLRLELSDISAPSSGRCRH